MDFDLSKRRRVGTGEVDCETAQRVNDLILKGEAPEDKELVSLVIMHTALCDTCRRKFLHNTAE